MNYCTWTALYGLCKGPNSLSFPAFPFNPRFSQLMAGGILGFGIATFLLWHLSAHPVMFFGFLLVVSNGWPARYEAHKLPGHTTFHRECYDAPIPLISAWWLLFRLFSFACLFLWLCVFCLFAGVVCSSFLRQWNCIIRLWHYEHRKPSTVSASLAVIRTASKHLHNDLAKAIEALEQKKTRFSQLISCKNKLVERLGKSYEGVGRKKLRMFGRIRNQEILPLGSRRNRAKTQMIQTLHIRILYSLTLLFLLGPSLERHPPTGGKKEMTQRLLFKFFLQ